MNLTAWKLAAFGVSAGLAGLAGGLLAAGIGSVSAGAFRFQQSLAVVAIAIVVGVRVGRRGRGRRDLPRSSGPSC